MSTPLELANSALEQAQALQALATDNNWEQVQKLQTKYVALINDIAISTVPENQQSEIRSILLQVKEINNATMALADKEKGNLVAQKKTIDQGAKMQKALNAFK